MLNFAFKEPLTTYYTHSKNQYLVFPSLTEQIEADVCIIGAGFLGLSTAIELAEQGKKVVVLEGARVGFGASGRSGGQAIGGFEKGLEDFISYLGLEKAQQIWQMSLEAVDIIHQRIKKYHIECDWQQGYATVATKAKHLEELSCLQEKIRNLFGYDGYQLWDKKRLHQTLGSPLYEGALYDPHSGHLHPLNYCLGLARAAYSLGARIFEHSPAIDLNKGKKIITSTPQAQVVSDTLVLATNAYIGELSKKLHHGIAAKIIPIESFIIATEVLDKSFAESLIANRMAVCDSNYLLDYYRISADNRLLFGSDSSRNVNMITKMRKNMLAVFPQLAEVGIDFAWRGPIDMTINSVPHFGRITPHIFFAQGFSGHGVALTGLAGRVISEAILGDDRRLALFEQLRVPSLYGGKWVKQIASRIGISYYKFLDRFF